MTTASPSASASLSIGPTLRPSSRARSRVRRAILDEIELRISGTLLVRTNKVSARLLRSVLVQTDQREGLLPVGMVMPKPSPSTVGLAPALIGADFVIAQ